jgi:hypothetical protein
MSAEEFIKKEVEKSISSFFSRQSTKLLGDKKSEIMIEIQ